MRLNDKLYDVLKWITLILLPAASTLFVSLAGIFGWPYASEVAKTTVAVCTFLGALLGISTAQYNKGGDDYSIDYDDDIYWDDDEDLEGDVNEPK